MTAPLILIVDDDVELCELLASYLSRNGFAVEARHTAAAAAARLGALPRPELLVLDVMLPDADGLALLAELRAQHELPVLMLSARGAPDDRVLGLELGADDYLAKPCVPNELVARLRALYRRRREGPRLAELAAGPLRIDPAARRAWVGTTELALTGAEFEILRTLVETPGALVTRRTLTERGLHRPLEAYDRSVDVHVSRLRQKLAACGTGAPTITGVRGHGYALKAAPDA